MRYILVIIEWGHGEGAYKQIKPSGATSLAIKILVVMIIYSYYTDITNLYVHWYKYFW